MRKTLLEPRRVVPTVGRYAGRPCWSFSTGELLPVVAGGDGEDGADKGDGGEGAGGDDAGAGDEGGEPRTFTQDDVDRIVADRLKRAKSTPPPDYDDLKTKAQKYDELEAQNKSELEKEREAREAADKKAEAATAAANTRIRRAEIITAAAGANAADAADVFALIEGNKKYSDMVTLDDDGEVTGAKEAVAALLKDKPHLVGKTPKPGSGDGGPRPDGGTKPKTLEDAVTAALKSG